MPRSARKQYLYDAKVYRTNETDTDNNSSYKSFLYIRNLLFILACAPTTTSLAQEQYITTPLVQEQYIRLKRSRARTAAKVNPQKLDTALRPINTFLS